ncbi:hypothetical protein A3B45_01745 [Candidatus Daviesbacteria bacterium RIFCSPLOWO2_01_FULL_39_12]|uniref:LamG-like jellyroll fold domain-containing protein n=1 Tax=Candidatus Daviesbacteria bacterium RIFCSPLOWO2_01_FULL_39_12 TaxID=1797785 RepID=A0A1F5KTK4_9BACT|nr:MAG: hypothetical protein A3B45_01745 [Candidatus Daviesbacteria bacterium RIFCSPLOWO2_01_FULL_39_12]
MPKRSGFTLIELLVVISIIAILSVVGIVIFTGVLKSARDAKRRVDIDAITKAFEVKYSQAASYGNVDPYSDENKQYFANGAPFDPKGTQYTVIKNTQTNGFRVCASLGDNSPCFAPSDTCFCRMSAQADPPDVTSGSGGVVVVTNADTLACPTSNLVGYWNMNQTLNDGTWNGGVTSVAGKVGNALNFNGTNGYVAAGNAASLQNLPTATLVAWIKPTTLSGYNNIISRTTYSNGGLILRASQGGSARLTPHVFTNTWYTCQSAVIPLNQWTHAAVTYDGTTLKGYINGAQACSSVPTVGGTLSPNATNWNIGADPGDFGTYFNGAIDEARVYSRVLTQTEISTLYNGCI